MDAEAGARTVACLTGQLGSCKEGWGGGGGALRFTGGVGVTMGTGAHPGGLGAMVGVGAHHGGLGLMMCQ